MLADGSANQFSLIPAGGFSKVALTRAAAISRACAADNLFWLGATQNAPTGRPPASLHRRRRPNAQDSSTRPNFPHCSKPSRCDANSNNTTKNPHDTIRRSDSRGVRPSITPVRWLECPRPSPRSIGRCAISSDRHVARVNNLADFPTDPIALMAKKAPARRTCSTCEPHGHHAWPRSAGRGSKA